MHRDTPQTHKNIKYSPFYLIISDQKNNLSIKEYAEYKEALAQRKNLFTANGYSSEMTSNKYLIASVVTFGRNTPVVVGYDTNTNPFKEEYQALKDFLRSTFNSGRHISFTKKSSICH